MWTVFAQPAFSLTWLYFKGGECVTACVCTSMFGNMFVREKEKEMKEGGGIFWDKREKKREGE